MEVRLAQSPTVRMRKSTDWTRQYFADHFCNPDQDIFAFYQGQHREAPETGATAIANYLHMTIIIRMQNRTDGHSFRVVLVFVKGSHTDQTFIVGTDVLAQLIR